MLGQSLILSKVTPIETSHTSSSENAASTDMTTVITHRVVIDSSGIASVAVKDRNIDVNSVFADSSLDPKETKYDKYSAFLQFIDELTLCPGCPEPHFVEMCKGSKGKSRDRSGKEMGYLRSQF